MKETCLTSKENPLRGKEIFIGITKRASFFTSLSTNGFWDILRFPFYYFFGLPATVLVLLFQFLPIASSAQCNISEYSGYRKVLKIEGDYVLEYSSYKRLYKFDGDYLVAYPSYKRLLKFEGSYVVRYSDYRRIAKLDGQYLVNYPNYRRIAILECPGHRSALAAAAYFLL